MAQQPTTGTVPVVQPAVKSYFFEGAFSDCKIVVTETQADIQNMTQALKARFTTKVDNKYLTTVMNFWGWSALTTFNICSYVIMAVMLGPHTAVTLTARLGCNVTMIALRGWDATWSKRWRIAHPCPTNYCMDCSPVFLCPNCNVKHSNLIPNQYGVFRRVCECNAVLPTMHNRGRKSLDCLCSECGQPIVNLKSSAVHVGFVGGPSSGKSNLFFMSQQELLDSNSSAGFSSCVYADPGQQAFIEQRLDNLRHGQAVPKTAEITPKAIQLVLERPKVPAPYSIYFYDVAGETFALDKDAATQHFYYTIDGIVFVIDPLSIESFHNLHQSEIKAQKLAVCSVPPEAAFSRMVGAMSPHLTEANRKLESVRIAVTVTKSDLFGIDLEIDSICNSLPADTVGDRRSRAVRQWLINQDQTNLVQLLEQEFGKSVRYYSVSALGRIPEASDQTSFRSVRVLDPIKWLAGPRLKWKG